ncbi:D-isomer specific 2-hydroxyacid dehydrogenase NAD-binding [Methylocella silvestris BL2]|uniref:D-isomer specific 2-hydroxyacid dehydrogenase NAD-binding n=1 Tax=Methylocella silvestris (strain DSM 15510 / CIP 108128 / LMG 27833 / NCIMB 13906 / BL2) TaxID=395965 RepID=B8ENX1_METSB|nr:D-2-hydroxyacid dehydrogenase family protein [Methylocella silvestris]ACK49209.1 D-isomer specific 2-hydroxyacid dehydrogenase NAD-binding [Methylocella silvestris BL2]
MNTTEPPPAIAILDDYQNVALKMANWTRVEERAAITVFNDHLADPEAVALRLAPFDILCVMRERTPLPRALLERLPRLKLIVTTGRRNASIDLTAAAERGIVVAHTGYSSTPTIEFAFSLILASVRNIASENASLRAGGWQRSLGGSLRGATLGVMGLGNIGAEMARLGLAFGMTIIAWSQNLTPERAAAAGATLVSKTELFEHSDILSIHLVLSGRTRGLVGAQELALMKPTARLVNSSRGPIVDESALIEALREGQIAGAAIDVFDCEPLPQDHPFRTLPNVLATPHIGYVSKDMYRVFYGDTVKNILAYLDGKPPPFLLTP